uniref:Immunoglobulin V-set domain-containing protein n=1 Tax=Dicentrarchus labrax TaxID=13489 RepID=A0A8C4H7G5_DICLA
MEAGILLDGNPPVRTLYPRPGGSITVECFFTVSGSRKYFCKDDCKEKYILVETTGDRGQKGRYRIRYLRGFPTGGFVYVSITQLTQSDSGQYRCGLDRPFLPDPYQEFRIIKVFTDSLSHFSQQDFFLSVCCCFFVSTKPKGEATGNTHNFPFLTENRRTI